MEILKQKLRNSYDLDIDQGQIDAVKFLKMLLTFAKWKFENTPIPLGLSENIERVAHMLIIIVNNQHKNVNEKVRRITWKEQNYGLITSINNERKWFITKIRF